MISKSALHYLCRHGEIIIVHFDWYCSHCEELIEPWSGSVLQPSTSSHVSFYINKSFFSPSLPLFLFLFLSCTPTQSLSEAHEDGRRKEGGGWSMTREKGKALLLTLHLQFSIYCFSIFLLSALLFPDTLCIQAYFLLPKLELLWIYTRSLFSLFSKLPNYPRSSLLWHRDVD